MIALRTPPVAVAVVVLVMLGAATASATRGPLVVPAKVGVPVFVGSGFTPRALVTVTLSTGALSTTRRVRANGTGGFLARFVHVAIDPCRGALVVRAVDERGIVSRWKQRCRPPSTTDPYPAS